MSEHSENPIGRRPEEDEYWDQERGKESEGGVEDGNHSLAEAMASEEPELAETMASEETELAEAMASKEPEASAKKAEKKKLRVSVRNLVEFVLRSGDLDNRRTAEAQRDAMQAGSKIHRKIQRRMGAGYRAEVVLKHLVEDEEFELLVEGRADGILTEGDEITVDEIKGVYLDVGYLEEPIQIHLAQAMCYGYFYCCDNQLDQIFLQVTYCNIETEEIRRFKQEKAVEELEEWFSSLAHEYMKWARYLYHNGLRRDESIHQIEFPFPYREGQRNLAVAVYRTISRKKTLFIQAPTGIGKTLSTVFPALKAIGEGYGEKLFYLTAKTITRSVAEEALAILRGNGLYFKSVTITSKEKLCFLEKPECNPDACPYAKGHYDRVNDAVYEIIHLEFGITRETVLRYAEKFQVCPFEFCLDITNWADGIICDYNYVFDPNVRLKRYFGEGMEGDYLFLVDEAHNLVSRARKMYSAVLLKGDVLAAKKLIKGRSPRLASQMDRVNKILLEMKRECASYCILEDVNHLTMAVMTMFGEMEKFLDDYREFENRDQVLEFYFEVRDFLNIYERLDSHYRIYDILLDDGDFMVKLLCVNPVVNLRECLDRGSGTVFFSATMLPIQYYRELLSNNPEDYAVYVDSPFPAKNRLLLIASDVTSRYTRRNSREYLRIVSYIRKVASAKPGNYMVFLPSYQYLEAVRREMEQIEGLEREFTWIVQFGHMTESDREEFLGQFHQDRKDTLVALCVMGGMFSEGIDLKEERLIGAVVVGTGLPMVCTEQEILKGYFDDQEKNGFDFAYQYPGMNKVLQAAGRVIRTVNDRGVILLLDDRFLRHDYQSLFPKEWTNYGIVNVGSVERKLREFWEEPR